MQLKLGEMEEREVEVVADPWGIRGYLYLPSKYHYSSSFTLEILVCGQKFLA
jgi:hypothetical protein